MSFERSREFAADVETTMDHFADAEATRDRYTSRGELDVEVLEAGRDDDGGATIVSRRVVEVEIPGAASKVLGRRNTLTQTDRWSPDGDGGYEADWTLEVAGAPVKGGGRMTLRPTEDGGSAYTTTGSVDVRVPLVGGRIADWMEDWAAKLLEREMDHHAKHLDDA